jgi:hypothetical protein
MEDDIGRACNNVIYTEKMRIYTQFYLVVLKGDLGKGGRIILKWILGI